MQALRKLGLVALGAFALGACTPQSGAPETPPVSSGTQASEAAGQSFPQAMSAADRAACTAAGGTVQRRGRIQAENCVRPFADAGRPCTDSAQCQGKCVGEVGDTASTAPVSGQCQADDHLFGCYSEVKGGKAVNAICVD